MDRAHKLAGELRDTEAALSKTSELMGAVVQYAKTRPVFDGYKAARYSRKYLAQHEAELADYRAAKTAMSELLGGAKLPKMDTLKKQHCGRPWQSRQISITCSATRTSKKIRPRSVSSGPPTTGACAGTSGQSVQKFSGFGELPNKHFHGPAACENFGVWPHSNCLPKRATPEVARKNGGTRFFYASSVSRAFCSPSAVYFITVSSFSSIELSMTSICFRQVLSPLSLSGKKN